MVYLLWSSFRIFSSNALGTGVLLSSLSWNLAASVIEFCVCLLVFSLSSYIVSPREQDYLLKNLVHYCLHNVYDWQDTE